jgi:uncharacterized protein YebE (UPF0316 family)
MRLKIGIFASSLSTAVSEGIQTLFSITTNFLFSTNQDKLYAYDGTNFESKDFPSINNLQYIEDIKKSFEIVVDNSKSATTWTTVNSNFGTTQIRSIVYNNGLWVAGGISGQIRTSTDATTWTTVNSNFGTTQIRSVAYGDDLWVAGGYSGQIRTSTPATTWTTVNSNFGTTQIRSIAYGDGLWVAGGYTGQIRTSTDATTWTTVTSNFEITFIFSISYGDGLWVAGGNAGQIRTSTDATTWTTVTSNLVSNVSSIAYGNNLWVAGGVSGQMRISENIFKNKYEKSTFALGNNGLLLKSTDNIVWNTISAPKNTNVNAIEYSDGVYFLGINNE